MTLPLAESLGAGVELRDPQAWRAVAAEAAMRKVVAASVPSVAALAIGHRNLLQALREARLAAWPGIAESESLAFPWLALPQLRAERRPNSHPLELTGPASPSSDVHLPRACRRSDPELAARCLQVQSRR